MLLGEDAPRAARLSYLEGEVTVDRVDNTGSDAAQRNMPLLEGARVTTMNGEAEIELEDGSVLRLTPRTAIALTTLASGAGQGGVQSVLTVLYGQAYAELRVTGTATTVIQAGGDIILPLSNAALRVQLDQPPPSIASLLGTLRVEHAGADAGSGFDVTVEEGEWLQETPQGGQPYTLSRTIPYDSWDDWNEHRAQAAMDQSADRTVARDGYAGDQGYGWSDLDSSGFWYDVAGQGLVWQPYDAAAPGFDPYAYGSWAYAGVGGYVWASSYTWGWTPYRCGSWAYSNNFGWGWSPGSNCGAGWSPGAGHGVNITRFPPGYHRPLPPDPHGPPHAHPLVVASTARPSPSATWEQQRLFGDVPALPLRPIAPPPVTRGASAVGAALRRDFPVDRTTRQPVLGVVRPPATLPATVAAGPLRGTGGGSSARGTPPRTAQTPGLPGQPARSAWSPVPPTSSFGGQSRVPGHPAGSAAPYSPVYVGPARTSPAWVAPVRPSPSPVRVTPVAPAPVHITPMPAPAAAPAKK